MLLAFTPKGFEVESSDQAQFYSTLKTFQDCLPHGIHGSTFTSEQLELLCCLAHKHLKAADCDLAYAFGVLQESSVIVE